MFSLQVPRVKDAKALPRPERPRQNFSPSIHNEYPKFMNIADSSRKRSCKKRLYAAFNAPFLLKDAHAAPKNYL